MDMEGLVLPSFSLMNSKLWSLLALLRFSFTTTTCNKTVLLLLSISFHRLLGQRFPYYLEQGKDKAVGEQGSKGSPMLHVRIFLPYTVVSKNLDYKLLRTRVYRQVPTRKEEAGLAEQALYTA